MKSGSASELSAQKKGSVSRLTVAGLQICTASILDMDEARWKQKPASR
jgi:hypothetical protein